MREGLRILNTALIHQDALKAINESKKAECKIVSKCVMLVSLLGSTNILHQCKILF